MKNTQKIFRLEGRSSFISSIKKNLHRIIPGVWRRRGAMFLTDVMDLVCKENNHSSNIVKISQKLRIHVSNPIFMTYKSTQLCTVISGGTSDQ